MAVEGADFNSDPSGWTIFGVDENGKVRHVAVDASTGRLLITTDTSDDTTVKIVRTAADASRELSFQDATAQALVEARVTNRLLAIIANVEPDLDAIRAEEAASVGT